MAGSSASKLYRKEALDVYRGVSRYEGDILRLSPRWVERAYPLLVAALIAGLMFAALARVGEYASGPAFVRMDGRVDMPAASDGVVASVLVRPGQSVDAGDVLIRYYPAREIEELERVSREIDLQIGTPQAGAPSAGATDPVASLRRQRALAEARLAERSVVAPQAGVVTDVRVHPGQRMAAGDVAISLTGSRASFSIVAVLPGQFRPLLRPGGRLRLDLAGYRYNSQQLTIYSVGERVVGPADVRRLLGDDAPSSLGSGPMVVVRARLPDPTFVEDGRTLAYYDGMPATAEVRVRAQPILVAVIPGLREYF